MDFRILGPLEVAHEGVPVDVKGLRQQTVLALLLLEANRIVPSDRLVDGVWDEDPPTTSRGQIQIAISSLRQQLPSDELGLGRIVTRAPGYLLRVADGELDLRLFDARVATGRRLADQRPRQAAEELRAALAFWRGPALSGIGSRLVRAGVAQLDERRLVVLEECLELELGLGAHHKLVGELSTLVAANPLRERLRVLLMTALFRAGRQAEALEEYRRARETFVDELGIEPGEELRRLQQAILTRDPVLTGEPAVPAVGTPAAGTPATASEHPAADPAAPAPPSVPRLLPAGIADFTGRAQTIERILAEPAGEAAGEQAVPVTVITGRGGVGKTTLAVHLAHRLASAFPDGQLFARLSNAAQPEKACDVLGRFLRALGVAAPAVPDGIEERAEMYRDRLAGRRVLVVLDDAVSESQVLPLLPGSAECRVLVTSRRRFTGLPAADRVEVSAFSQLSSAELLARIAGRSRITAEPEAVAALCELCGQLPLALRIVAARLAARPHWSVSDLIERLTDESRRLDELRHGEMGVRASISLTYESLSPDARRLFRLLALLETPSFASWIGAPLLRTDPLRGQDLLEELAESYLLDVEVDSTTRSARYRFHDLVRTFARERLATEEPPSARQEALERILGALLFLTGEAHRREYGGEFMLTRSPAGRWELPPRLVDRVLADPLGWYDQERMWIVSAVRQAAASGLAGHAWGLAMNAVTLFEARAHFHDWRETHDLALRAARQAGDRLGEAAMRYSAGSLDMFEQQFTPAAEQFERALALYQELGDRHGAAMVLRNMAFLDRMNGRLDDALDRCRQAMAVFEEAGDRIGEAHVLNHMAQIHLEYGEHELARGLLERALRVCQGLGNRRVGAQVLHRLGEARLALGDLDGALADFRQVLADVRLAEDHIGETYALLGLAEVHRLRGDQAAAGELLAAADTLAVTVGERLAEARVALALGELSLEADELELAWVRAARARELFTEMRAPLFQACALELCGRVHAAAGRRAQAAECRRDALAAVVGLDSARVRRLVQRLKEQLARPERPSGPGLLRAAGATRFPGS
ncbi:AfsR/SARP family transcriptional regulator [Kitasatospora sp. NPDC052896]|uniref:AfsR/SARP family transcriptional regulator n=1 Tax=Kitasatospora sp. NPDC052896 TaxID=3364061 RepID=UPI0037CC211C